MRVSDPLFDQFTYLHFACGIITYFWGISFTNSILIHTLYEIFEVTPIGVHIINTYFGKLWPGGGKSLKEIEVNALGDTIGFIIGWVSAMALDNIGNKYGWYELHIK